MQGGRAGAPPGGVPRPGLEPGSPPVPELSADPVPQCGDLLRTGYSGARVSLLRGCAGPRRYSGARKGRDLVRARPRTVHSAGSAGADLPADRVTRELVVRVADLRSGLEGDTLVTVGLGSCVAIMLHDQEAKVGGMA